MLQLYGKVLQGPNIEVKDLALTAINFTTYQFEISKQRMCHFLASSEEKNVIYYVVYCVKCR